jgi:ubiquinone/menaquinone biosynthesis C-methylase UbiE
LNEQIDVFYDGRKIPFEDEYFDAVFSTEVFEHIFNLEEILKEINRVMKVSGKILITCPFAICEHEVPNDFARYSSYAINIFLKKMVLRSYTRRRLAIMLKQSSSYGSRMFISISRPFFEKFR